MNNFSFKSSLGEEMRQYVRLKIALGRRYKEGIAILQSLDRFLSDLPWRRQDLTAETFESWCKTQTGVTARVRRQRMYVIHNFCLYRRRTVPECFVPNSNLFPVWKKYQTITPYIFSASEVAKLMKAALNLERTIVAPLRPEVIRLGIMLLYTSGLRHREVLRLVISDFDRRQGTLLIRASKFHKTRVVPLSPGVTREIDRYLRLRCCHKLPAQSNTPLISHQKQGLKGYSLQGFWYNFRCLLNTCNIRTASGGLPRIHDLRHSCAVEILVRWYRASIDVQAKLPLLSAYLGHVSIASTYYYLRFVEPLRILASRRFNDAFGQLIEPVRIQERGRR